VRGARALGLSGANITDLIEDLRKPNSVFAPYLSLDTLAKRHLESALLTLHMGWVGLPGRPSPVSVLDAGCGRMLMGWTKPRNTGGSMIHRYVVRRRRLVVYHADSVDEQVDGINGGSGGGKWSGGRSESRTRTRHGHGYGHGHGHTGARNSF